MRIVQQILSFAFTLYLFTAGDMVVIISITVALVLAGPTDWWSFLVALVWLELFLCAANVKNQIIGFEEDEICKPYRPLVLGRLTLQQSEYLYRSCIALCFIMSYFHGLLHVATPCVAAGLLYHEAGWAKDPIAKSLLTGIAYLCFAWGSTFIVGHHQPLSDTSIAGITMVFLIFTTTGHAHDFRDRSGDAAIGRKTIPIVLSRVVARWTMVMLLLSWTTGLILFWRTPLVPATIFALLGLMASITFVTNKTEEDDRKNLFWYNYWLFCASILPLFWRVHKTEIFLPALITSNLNIAQPLLSFIPRGILY